MRSIERSGVVVDRCSECGGLFLDRGELEKLMEAEGTYNNSRGWRHEDDDDERRGYGGRRRGGFLSGMFGGDD
jgi:hypothetical protein